VNLPDAGSRSFWLHRSAWQFPDGDKFKFDLTLSRVPLTTEGQSLSHRTPPEYDRRKQSHGVTYRSATGLADHAQTDAAVDRGRRWDKVLTELIVRDDAVGSGRHCLPEICLTCSSRRHPRSRPI
jgi:hypothetical protein